MAGYTQVVANVSKVRHCCFVTREQTEQNKKGTGGRPTDYTPELAAALCADISFCEEEQRGLKVHEACKRHGISVSSFFLWLTKHEEFSEAYALAREARAEQLFEETLAIPDSLPDRTMWEIPDGRRFDDIKDVPEEWRDKAMLKGLSSESVAKARLQTDSRKWYLSKLMPKKYGDKITQEKTGPDGGPIEMKITWEAD